MQSATDDGRWRTSKCALVGKRAVRPAGAHGSGQLGLQCLELGLDAGQLGERVGDHRRRVRPTWSRGRTPASSAWY
jgi:hypothetical protein